jgi:ADP-Ribosyltransferase in polyvalent proteins
MVNPLIEAAGGLATPSAIARAAAMTARGRRSYAPANQPPLEDQFENQENGLQPAVPQPEQKQGWGAWAGGMALNTIGAVGNVLDLPGSSVRDVISGKNPLDQWLDPFGRDAQNNRTDGRTMLRNAGLVGKEDNWKNFIGGIGLEIALDPTTWVGAGALTRAGAAMKSLGVNGKKFKSVAKEMAEMGNDVVTKPKSSTWIGNWVGGLTQTPSQIFKHAERIVEKKIIPSLDGTIEGKLHKAADKKVTFGSADELKNVPVSAEESAWAMVDNGKELEVFKNAEGGTEWAKDFEATRRANHTLSQSAMGATPEQLRKGFIDSHRFNYGKGKSEEAYLELLAKDLETPLRSKVSIGVPFMQPVAEFTKNNPQEAWNKWLSKQDDLPAGNKLDPNTPPDAAGPSAGGTGPTGGSGPSPRAPKSPEEIAAETAARDARAAADAEASVRRAKFTLQEGRELLKGFGRTDLELDALGDQGIYKEVGKYGLIDKSGLIRRSSLGDEGTRVLHQAARTFGPSAVLAWPVIETMAKTWSKINGKKPGEYFASLTVKASDEVGDDIARWEMKPLPLGTDEATKNVMRVGERLILGMKGASLREFVHESGHDLRAMLGDSYLNEKMANAVGDMLEGAPVLDAKTGKWTREAEEAWADAFEAYVANGVDAPKGLKGAFDRIKEFIADIWRTVKGEEKLKEYVNPSLQAVFDEILSPSRIQKKAQNKAGKAAAASIAANAADAVDSGLDEGGKTADAAGEAGGLTPEAYEQFVKDGTVDDSILESIASKISKGEKLSDQEQAILAAKGTEVESRLRQKAAAEAGQNTASNTKPGGDLDTGASGSKDPIVTPGSQGNTPDVTAQDASYDPVVVQDLMKTGLREDAAIRLAKQARAERLRLAEIKAAIDANDRNVESQIKSAQASGGQREIKNTLDLTGGVNKTPATPINQPFRQGERTMIVAEVNGVKIPFYISTGQGGKKSVPTGKWYPFFGLGKDGWLNKGSEEQVLNFYNNPHLAAKAKELDEKFGDLRYEVLPHTNFNVNEGLSPVSHGESAGESILSVLKRIDTGNAAADATKVDTPSVDKTANTAAGTIRTNADTIRPSVTPEVQGNTVKNPATGKDADISGQTAAQVLEDPTKNMDANTKSVWEMFKADPNGRYFFKLGTKFDIGQIQKALASEFGFEGKITNSRVDGGLEWFIDPASVKQKDAVGTSDSVVANAAAETTASRVDGVMKEAASTPVVTKTADTNPLVAAAADAPKQKPLASLQSVIRERFKSSQEVELIVQSFTSIVDALAKAAGKTADDYLKAEFTNVKKVSDAIGSTKGDALLQSDEAVEYWRSKNGVYAHGTTDANDIGDMLLPPKDTGVISEKGRKKNLDAVFFTKTPKAASIYAGRAARSIGGKPVILEVIPVGEVKALNTTPGSEVFYAEKAIVIRSDGSRQVVSAKGASDAADPNILYQGDSAVAGASKQELEAAKAEWKAKNVKSSFFKRWFGDWESDRANASKVVDKDGKPLVLYHGTDADFNKFSNPYADDVSGDWSMFSESPEYSQNFARGRTGVLMPVFLDIKNPLDLSDLPARRGDVRNKIISKLKNLGFDMKVLEKALPHERDLFQFINRKGFRGELTKQARELGYDGIKMPDSFDDGAGDVLATTWVSFQPGQIKSATGNRGTFDAADPNILYQGGPKKTMQGEYWLQDGHAQYAGGDIGDLNHEAIAEQYAQSDIASRLGVDIDYDSGWDNTREKISSEILDSADDAARADLEARIDDGDLDDIIREKLIEDGLTAEKADELLSVANGRADSRLWAAQELGWVRMQGNNLEAYGLTKDKLKSIANSLPDDVDDIEQEFFDIYDYKTKKFYNDVPFSVVESGDMGKLREYQALYQHDPDAARASTANAKGAVKFESNEVEAFARVFLSDKADISTVAHELGHIARRRLNEAMQKKAEALYGVKRSKWSTSQEEAFARDFENYLATGEAAEGLQGVFAKMKEWIGKVYSGITGSPLDKNLSQEKRELFDEMFGRTKKADSTVAKTPSGQMLLEGFDQASSLPPKNVISELADQTSTTAGPKFSPGQMELNLEDTAATIAPKPAPLAAFSRRGKAETLPDSKSRDALVGKQTPTASKTANTAPGLSTAAKAADEAAPSDAIIGNKVAQNSLDHARNAEKVLGLDAKGKSLSDLESLPDASRELLEDSLRLDSPYVASKDKAGFINSVREAAESIAGREISDDELGSVVKWLDSTSDKFKIAMSAVDDAYAAYPGKIDAVGSVKENLGSALRGSVKKPEAKNLDTGATIELLGKISGLLSKNSEYLGKINQIEEAYKTGMPAKEIEKLQAEAKKALDSVLDEHKASDLQKRAIHGLMTKNVDSVKTVRRNLINRANRETILDTLSQGGRPKKPLPDYVGGEAGELAAMKLSESIKSISYIDLKSAVPGASDEELKQIAESIGAKLKGVSVESTPKKIGAGDTVAALKEKLEELPRTKANKSEREAIKARIAEKESAGRIVDDAQAKSTYIRMNALKMLGKQAKDAGDDQAARVYAALAEQDALKLYSYEAPRFYGPKSQGDIGGDTIMELIARHDWTQSAVIPKKTIFAKMKSANSKAQKDLGAGLNKAGTEVPGDVAKDVKPTIQTYDPQKANAPAAASSSVDLSGLNLTAEEQALWDAATGVVGNKSLEKIDVSDEGVKAAANAIKKKLGGDLKDAEARWEVIAGKIAQARTNPAVVSLSKKRTPQVVAASIEKHEMASKQWHEIIAMIKDPDAKQMILQAMDVGGVFISSNPGTLMLARLFDAEVMGAGTLQEQDLARKLYKANERAVAAFRDIMGGITHYVGRQGYFDHKAIAADLITNQKMDRVEAIKQATGVINKRNAEMRKFLEAEGHHIDPALFNATPEQAKELESLLTSIRDMLDGSIDEELWSGLSGRKLVDPYAKYVPRNKTEPDKSLLRADNNKSMLDAKLDSQIGREEHLKNLPGRTEVLDAMSLDPAISGVAHDQAILTKGLYGETKAKVMKHIQENYMEDLLDPKLIENGKPTEEGIKKLELIANTITWLPKTHVQEQVPMFGNNVLRDLAVYFEQSHMKQSAALAAQGLAIKNMTVDGEQKYLLDAFFRDINTDNHMAYFNVIRHTGRLNDYKKFADNAIQKMLKDETLTEEAGGLFKIEGNPKALTADEVAEQRMLARQYTVDKKLGVSPKTYGAATYWLQAFARPQEMTVLKKIMAANLNMFKSMVTIPFPGFHGRNKGSGMIMNYFFGAYDPTGFGPMRYLKPEIQALSLRNGQPIKGIASELPEHISRLAFEKIGLNPKKIPPEQQDAIVTDWIRSQVFKYTLVGDRMGVAAEKVGDTASSLMSQSPGSVKKDKSNWFGFRNAIMDPTTSKWQKANPMAFDGVPKVGIDKSGPRPKLDLQAYDETTNVIGAVGSEMGKLVEDGNRIAPFLAFLKQGMVPEEAARMVHMIQFDYSKLTNFEKVLKQWIPFYTFSSKALKLTVTDLLENPGGKQAWSIRAANRAQDPDKPMPENIRRGLAIPLGKGADGQDRYISGLGLAWEDPLEMLSFLHGDFKSSVAAGFTKLRPEAQGFAEGVFGRSAYFDRELTDMDPQLGRARDNLLGKERKGLAEPLMGSQSLEFLSGKTPVARVASTLNNALDSRKNVFEKALNLGTGVKITDVNQEAAERLMIDQASEKLKGLGAREMEVSYIPEWKKERMSPEELQVAQELQKMISSIKSTQRERKKNTEVNALRAAAAGSDGL